MVKCQICDEKVKSQNLVYHYAYNHILVSCTIQEKLRIYRGGYISGKDYPLHLYVHAEDAMWLHLWKLAEDIRVSEDDIRNPERVLKDLFYIWMNKMLNKAPSSYLLSKRHAEGVAYEAEEKENEVRKNVNLGIDKLLYEPKERVIMAGGWQK